MTTSTNTLIDIDKEFDDVIFDEVSIRKSTAQKNSYYNNPGRKLVGENAPFYGKTHSEKTRKLLSETHIGLQAGEKNPMYGKTHTDEVKQQSRERNKIYYENNDPTFLGKKHTEETKKLMSVKRGNRATVELKPCYAIDPQGNRFEFNSITECSKSLDYPSLMGNAHILLPENGTPWKVQRGKFKGWSFARII
jgi:hypothetical protein